ncbi:hypothetical protein B9Z55_016630 [Caenorhabditis nigoni]|uniref:F-box domain-containing protein n=1 Tax=Caenorhabditis nigoni TaxID=1611254 RepID=A0A2G5T5Y1_9PELO|nr:hypothetical protein B9Z55_016630 [Caenorhabditis nigoni]
MPVNLLKLPSLVGVMVVTEMDHQQIFLLSILSRRTHLLVKQAQIRAHQLTFQFDECDGYDTFQIGIVTDMMKWLPVTTVLHRNALALENVLTVKLGMDYRADTNFDSWCEEDGRFEHRIECANEPMSIQKAFQDHLKSIFHYSKTYQLRLSMKCKGQLPNLTNVRYILLNDDTVDPQFFTNVLTTYPNCQLLCVLSSIVGEMPKESPFFQVQSIIVECPCGPDYFLNFAGRNMWLKRATLTHQDLIQFLQKWISNEAYHDLEVLSIATEPTCRVNGNLIRETIEFEEYDPNEPEKRPEHFVVDVPYIGSTPTKYDLRDRSFVEIKRTTDGRRAFLRCDFLFQLYVFKNSPN